MPERTWLLLILLLMSSVGCRAERDVTVFISGDTTGWITPCGCAANQSGGLARRATLIADSAEQGPVVVLDAGGSATGTNEYHRLKLMALLRGLSQLQLDAHNVGASESAFSPSELKAIGEEAKIKWLSANLSDNQGASFGSQVLLLERGGLKIAVTGVIEPSRVVHGDWRASDAKAAVIKAFKNVDAQVRIVLAYFDESGLRSLAESLPEVDYVIGGPTGQAMSRTHVGKVSVLSATNKGKFIGQLVLHRNKNRYEEKSASLVEVKSTLVERADQVRNLNHYYANLLQRDFSSKETGLVQSASGNQKGFSIAGSEACQRCHAKDDAVWHASKHSHAWEPLLAKQAHGDPSCQQCHTTGYGIEGGFEKVALSTDRIHVGCENCHGPSAAHVRDPKIKTPFLAKEQCLRCHDHENSPSFVLDPYWTRIFHAGSKQAAVQ